MEFLSGEASVSLSHDELEVCLEVDSRALIRQLLQDHLDLRAGREQRVSGVVDAAGRVRNVVEPGHRRRLGTIFGEVAVTRLAYRARNAENLHVADGVLNLPVGLHSHGIRRLCALEATRGSYEEAKDSLLRSTGVSLGKRQVEELTAAASVDFAAFYESRKRPAAGDGEVIVVSADGKGVVMRPEGLRAQTAAAAARSHNKLAGRLSKGEKANRKRMAEVGTVYTVAPVVRRPEDVMAKASQDNRSDQAPKAAAKWVTASVADDARTVIATLFDEAARRDPGNACDWVALVDGNRHQIDRINAEAKARHLKVTVVCDFVHVLEYLWKAAWSFFGEGDRNAETWVEDKALAVLAGKASIVAAAIRRKATTLRLDHTARKNADTCADYLLAKAPYLNYPHALAKGWPIATGVIEGACRHVVKDRMDITGARWGLNGAEAVLKLRAIRANGDFDDYWRFHLDQERHRVHETRYTANVLPTAA